MGVVERTSGTQRFCQPLNSWPDNVPIWDKARRLLWPIKAIIWRVKLSGLNLMILAGNCALGIEWGQELLVLAGGRVDVWQQRKIFIGVSEAAVLVRMRVAVRMPLLP